MKRFATKLLISAALLLLCLNGWSQKKLYTRSFMIQDFKSKTTKVVLSGSAELNASLRAEITSFWTITPYEFCSKAEYDKQRNSPDYYFLHPETNKGIVYLTLSRGGKEGDQDALKLPVTLVSLPISGENDNSGRERIYMPAFISLLQDFTESALQSEYVAYTGLRAICKRKPKTTTVITGADEADEAFISQFTDSAVELIISPDGNPKSKPRYHMVIDTSTYQLYSYAKH